MFVNRTLVKSIIDGLKYYPVVAITGPRQSGKSTLLKQILSDYKYVSLENPDHRLFARKDPNGFLAQYGPKLVIDEAQLIPDLFSYIQTIVDDNKQMGQYVLSGSQNFLLHSKIKQSLAGRVAIYKLFPFDISELKKVNLLTPEYEETLFKGLYPALYTRSIPTNLFYKNYLSTYIEKDVTDEFGITNSTMFIKFIRLCAGHVGQQVNYSEFSKILGVSLPTIRFWFSILETSYIIHLLQPHFNNFNKRLVKSPKLYFYDTGLVTYLLGIRNVEEFVMHSYKGALFENFIINEYVKQNYHLQLDKNFYYWKESSGNEVDLIIENGLKYDALEIKATKTIVPKLFKGLDKFKEISGDFIHDKILVYGGNESQKRTNYTVKAWHDVK